MTGHRSTRVAGVTTSCVTSPWRIVLSLGGLLALALALDGCAGASTCAMRQHLTAAEMAASPRGDRALETLAAELSGTVAADPAIYARLERDVGAMVAADPSIAHVRYRAPWGTTTLYVEADPDAEARIMAGTDPRFEALRRLFPPARVFVVSAGYHAVVVEHERVYDFARLREYYRTIPGVADVGLDVLMGDGPTMCVETDADVWRYYFFDAGGDCPAGCTTLRLVVFETDASGATTRVGEVGSVEGAPAATGAEITEAAMGCVVARQHAAARTTEICAP